MNNSRYGTELLTRGFGPSAIAFGLAQDCAEVFFREEGGDHRAGFGWAQGIRRLHIKDRLCLFCIVRVKLLPLGELRHECGRWDLHSLFRIC